MKNNDAPQKESKIAINHGPMGRGRRQVPIQKAKDIKGTIKRLLKYLDKRKIKLIIVFVLVIISSLTGIGGTLLLKPAIDKYILKGDLQGLIGIGILFLSIVLTGSIAMFLQNRIMVKIAQNTVRDLRKDVFNKLIKLPIKFYDTHSHGELMSRIINDLQNVTDSITSSIIQLFSSTVTILGVFIGMLIINPILTLITIILIPITIFITIKIARINRKQFIKQQESLGELNGYIEEYISGQYVVKAFKMEERNLELFTDINERYRKIGIKAESYANIVMPLSRNLNGITYAIIIIVAGILGVRGRLSIGDFTTFVRFGRQFGQPINEIASQFSSIQLGIASAERCFEIIDEEEEVVKDINKIELENVKGEVIFENVNFSYTDNKKVLKDINIKVNPGEMVALVGETGAGKTTIINLLTRFYDVESGKILIDGIDVRDMTRDSLREALGIVLQDTILFSETIKENILYGKLNSTDEEINEAAKLARADSFVNRLADGYETVINEDASNLSVGQKQLLNIARVFLNQPKILILDEATSNVDTRTEIHIQEAIKELMKGRTSFVIAHRLSTIRNADKIIVIENGEIIECGTHKELIAKEGAYYQLYMGLQG